MTCDLAERQMQFQMQRQPGGEPEQGAGRPEDAAMEEQRSVALGLRMRHLQMRAALPLCLSRSRPPLFSICCQLFCAMNSNSRCRRFIAQSNCRRFCAA
jgi:hypothetical protein